MVKLKYAFLIATSAILVSCNNARTTSEQNHTDSSVNSVTVDSNNLALTQSEASTYQKETINEATAKNLTTFLKSYLQEDIKGMAEADRTFSFYELDLNGDNKNEYFIKLPEKGFCGSGGCTFLLLDNSLQLINRFTVTNPPIYVGSAGVDGWKTLLLQGKNANKFVHLTWDSNKKKYPSNPSLIEENEQVPSEKDYIMWQDSTKFRTFQF